MTLSWVLPAGVALGIVYTLSPLTVLCLTLLVAATRWAGRDLTGRERQWFFVLVTVAVVSRLLIIAGLFLLADSSRPYATFFGDEEIFKSRPIWLRNIGLGVPVSAADTIYAFDETGMSGHLYVLAFVQAIVGDAPYGAHVLNAVLFVGSVLVLHRLIRPAYGRMVAMGGLVVLLFLPTLFSWSISALKEPVYTVVAVAELVCVMAIVRARRWWQRGLAVATLVVLALALDSLRKGTLIVASLGAVVGVSAGLVLPRPRLRLAAAIAVPIAAGLALSTPAVHNRLLTIGRESVRYHVGHVVTPGVSYKIIDPRYYADWPAIQRIGGREATVYVARSVLSYFVEPLPSNTGSTRLWAYLPEHLFWWLLVVLVPIGFRAGLQRDPLLTCVLAAHAGAIIMMVAMTSGNIGTLIRHRGLSLPYLVWLSALGAYTLVAWTVPASVQISEREHAHGDC